MLSTTLDAIKSILRADPTITVSERLAIVACIREHGRRQPPQKEVNTDNRIMRRKEVAELFSRNVRAIDRMAKDGILNKVQLPGRRKCCGFRSQDVARLIEAGNV